MKYADLHLHTVFSDGTYTPQEVVSRSAECGLSAIAVVDHDSVKGIGPSIEIAKTLGIEIIPGIELSAEYQGMEVHILGYLFDYTDGKLNEQLERLNKSRVERIYKITDKLNEIGVRLDPEKVFALATKGTVGRLHLARALVKEGLVNSLQEAFRKYIGDKCPAFVLGFKFSPKEAIQLIRDSGGIPVIAHPYSLNNDELIPEFASYGLMGIEVYYPEHSQAMVNFYLGLVKEHNLLVTGGSDCHGEAKPAVKIGSIRIPYELVENLKLATKEKIQ